MREELLVARDLRAIDLRDAIERLQPRAHRRALGERGRDHRQPLLRAEAEPALLHCLEDRPVLDRLGRDLDGERLACAHDAERELPVRVRLDDLLQIREALHGRAIDAGDLIARLQAGGRGGRARLDEADRRRELALRPEQEREEDDEREREVCEGSGRRDQPARERRGLDEAAPAIFRLGLLERVVAGELHVAAEREQREPHLRLAHPEAEDLGTEADGELLRLHAAPEADQQVAELVEEDDGHDHGDKGREREARGFQPDEK